MGNYDIRNVLRKGCEKFSFLQRFQHVFNT